MKARLLLGLFILIFSSKLFPQTNFRFADSTAQWSVLSNYYYGGPSSATWTVGGDTIIWWNNYQNVVCNNASFSLRKDSLNRVFNTRDNGTDFMIYDFNASKGDTFLLKTQQITIPNLSVEIDSIDTIFLDKYRKRIFVKYFSYSVSFSVDFPYEMYSYHDVWIEGIGALYTPFYLPGFDANWIGGPDYSLLCFSENGNTLYQQVNFSSCTITGIAMTDDSYSIKISPNPTTESFITIQSETNFPEQTTFQLFDITGRMVLQKQLNDKTERVGLSEVSKGMYLYNIAASGQKINSGKLAVQ